MDRTSDVSKRLKEYREIHGLTLSELSAKCGVPAQTLNRYELEQRIPKIDTAVSIAEALGINPLWLQGYNVPIEKPTAGQGDGPKERAHKLIDDLPEDKLQVKGCHTGCQKKRAALQQPSFQKFFIAPAAPCTGAGLRGPCRTRSPSWNPSSP